MLTRRRWLSKMFRAGVVGGVGAGGAFADGSLRQRHELRVERIELRMEGLPRGFDGLRVVQLSDLHHQPWTKLPELAAAVEQANALEPDLTVLTGDYVTTKLDPIFPLAPVLGRLRARLGVFGVLGNHDYRSGDHGDRVARAVEAAGVPLLRNDGVFLHQGSDRLRLAGLESLRRGRPGLHRALHGMRSGERALLLMHEPDYADVAAKDPRVGVQLSGHSHGGQVCLPGGTVLHTPEGAKRYRTGHYTVGAMHLWVNRGIGCTGLPVRFACPPEITEITLRRSG